MKTQQKEDTCQGDICNLRVFIPIFAKIMITSPSKMNKQKGGGNQFSETPRYLKLFELLQIDDFQQLIQSHL